MVQNRKNNEKDFKYIPIIIMFIPIVLVIWFLNEVYGTLYSVQIFVIISGTLIIIAFLVARIFNYPKINQLNPKVAKLYFSTISNFILAIFAGFGIAFSILWGSLYTYAISEGKLEEYAMDLKGQGIILIIFLICTSTAIFFSYMLPLLHQINKTN